MKKTRQQFRNWAHKSVTLLGMSSVGKTTLAHILPSDTWFHYAADYRIGSRYLNEPIRDFIKCKAMEMAFFRDLFRRDLVRIRNNISSSNLQLISHFLGKIGNPELGGLSVAEFKRRQALFREAEVHAMRDVREFLGKARNIYGYPHFLNDAGGSICELGDAECWDYLSQETLVLYLHADQELESILLQRALSNPKPLYYDEAFLDKNLREYMEIHGLKSSDEIVPDEFVIWVFPRLIAHRKPRYQSLAERFGHTVDAAQIFNLRDEKDFIDLVCDAIGKA